MSCQLITQSLVDSKMNLDMGFRTMISRCGLATRRKEVGGRMPERDSWFSRQSDKLRETELSQGVADIGSHSRRTWGERR